MDGLRLRLGEKLQSCRMLDPRKFSLDLFGGGEIVDTSRIFSSLFSNRFKLYLNFDCSSLS